MMHVQYSYRINTRGVVIKYLTIGSTGACALPHDLSMLGLWIERTYQAMHIVCFATIRLCEPCKIMIGVRMHLA